MAKKGTRENLRLDLELGMGLYAKGAAKAKAQAQTDGNAINKFLGDAANKVALRFFSIDAAIRAAEKGVKAFARTAEQLEKQGKGDEGTAAVTRLSRAIDALWERFVRATLSSKAFRAILGYLADGVEYLGDNMHIVTDVVEKGARGLIMFVGHAQIALGSLLTEVGSFANGLGNVMSRLGAEAMGTDVSGAQGPLQAAGASLTASGEGKLAMAESLTFGRGASRMGGFEGGGPGGENAFGKAVDSTVDSFIGSWETGLDRLGKLFQEFPEQVAQSFTLVSQAALPAIGNVFEALTFGGNLAQRVFGQSEKATRIFAAAQLAVTAIMSLVKGKFELAEATSDAAKPNPAGAALHKAAAIGYFAAAALAGVGAVQALTAGGGGSGVAAASSGITDPKDFQRERKTVTVIIQNAFGRKGFVREVLIPEINEAVGDDVAVLASSALAAERIESGRFSST